MVEYIFDNQRSAGSVATVIFTTSKPNTETLTKYLKEDEAETVAHYVRQQSPKNGDIIELNTQKHKIIAVIT